MKQSSCEIAGHAVMAIWRYKTSGDRQHPHKRAVEIEVLKYECVNCGAPLSKSASVDTGSTEQKRPVQTGHDALVSNLADSNGEVKHG